MRAMLVAVGSLIVVACTVADESTAPAINETVSAAVDATVQARIDSGGESGQNDPTPVGTLIPPSTPPPPTSEPQESVEVVPRTSIHCADCPLVDVERVIDGDTIDTSIGRVRFFGVDTPERGDACFSEATDFTTQLVRDGVRLEDGPRLTDSFGRRLAYIYDASGNSVDEQIVAGGFGRAWTKDGQHLELLVGLQESAQSNGAGCLWGGGGGLTSSDPPSVPTSTVQTSPTADPTETFVDLDCGDFATWDMAQAFFLAEGGPDRDPHRLDGDNDGIACEALSGAPAPAPPATATTSDPSGSGLLYDPSGPDRDCGDFGRWGDAQAFYRAAGGPASDRHRLDGDRDGVACESLPGAP